MRPRVLRGPVEPTQEERRLHRTTHIPMMNWCKACVFGQTPDEASNTVKDPGDSEQYCRISLDYMFLTQRLRVLKRDEGEAEDDGRGVEERVRKMITTLVVKDHMGKRS